MNLGRLTKQAKQLIDKRGGTGALKDDAKELGDIMKRKGSAGDSQGSRHGAQGPGHAGQGAGAPASGREAGVQALLGASHPECWGI